MYSTYIQNNVACTIHTHVQMYMQIHSMSIIIILARVKYEVVQITCRFYSYRDFTQHLVTSVHRHVHV